MKSLWKTILDGLTYPDLAGKRQLRAYTVITIAILTLLVLVGGFILFRRIQLMRRVKAAPIPVSLTAGPAPVSTTTPTNPAADEPGCPTDADQWSLADAVISNHYKLIQPACVYAGLEKTIAWTLAVRNGFSRADATQILGFDEMPMRRLDQVTILTDTQGPLSIPVSFIPPNQDFTEWHVNAAAESAVVYALRGCFRTSSVVGNRLETWGGEYAVICVVIEDAENTRVIYQLGEHVYTSPATPTRSFLLYGYAGDGTWVWLGTQSDPKIEIADAARYARDRLTIATLYDSQPWDMQWLQSHYQLAMMSLPENWQTRNDEAEKQAILAALNASGTGGE